MEKESRCLKKRINEVESEISNLIRAIQKGTTLTKRLEAEITKLEADQDVLRAQLDDVNRRINETITRNFNAELVRRHLKDFQRIIDTLTPEEKTEAVQCILKDVIVHPDKLVLNIYELPEFKRGSQKRTKWLPRLDEVRTFIKAPNHSVADGI